MTADDVSDQPSTTGKADPPPLLPEGGLDAYSVHSDYMKVWERDIDAMKVKY